jgi:hypothetical protein
MKIIEINVTKKDHLKSLVMDFRRAGFQLVTFGYELFGSFCRWSAGFNAYSKAISGARLARPCRS